MFPCQDLFQGLQELSAALNRNLEYLSFSPWCGVAPTLGATRGWPGGTSLAK